MDTNSHYATSYATSQVIGAGGGLAKSVGVPTPVNPSCFGNIEDAASSASSVAQRAERLANRLCGERPADTSTAQAEIGPNGLFDAADTQARYIRGSMERIVNALNRIEGCLP